MTKFTIYYYTLTFFAHNYFPFPFISWSMCVCITYMKLNIHVLVKLFFLHCHQEFFAPLRLCSKVYPVSVPSRSVLASLEDISNNSLRFDLFLGHVLFHTFYSFLVLSFHFIHSFLVYNTIVSFLVSKWHRWPLLTL